MRTNIDIDDELMRQAMAATNTTTKKAAVEASLGLAVRLKSQLKAQQGILKWFGKIDWDGDLAASRESRFLDWEDGDWKNSDRKDGREEADASHDAVQTIAP